MSNLVVKMMSGELLPDENKAKGFTLVEAFGQVTCERNAEGKPRIEIPTEDGRLAAYFPEGNTYLIKNGKTVASFSHEVYIEGSTLKRINVLSDDIILNSAYYIFNEAEKDDTPNYENILLVDSNIYCDEIVKTLGDKDYLIEKEIFHPEYKRNFVVFLKKPIRIYVGDISIRKTEPSIFNLPMWIKSHKNVNPLKGWYVQHDEIHWFLKPDMMKLIGDAQHISDVNELLDRSSHLLPKLIMLPPEANESGPSTYVNHKINTDYIFIGFFNEANPFERQRVYALRYEFAIQ